MTALPISPQTVFVTDVEVAEEEKEEEEDAEEEGEEEEDVEEEGKWE